MVALQLDLDRLCELLEHFEGSLDAIVGQVLEPLPINILLRADLRLYLIGEIAQSVRECLRWVAEVVDNFVHEDSVTPGDLRG